MKKELRYSLIISLIYLALGILWICLSDFFLDLITTNVSQYKHLQSVKGILFVSLSSVTIFFLIWLFYKKYNRYYTKFLNQQKESDLIFSEFPIGIAVLNLEGRLIKTNKMLSQILGFSNEELLALTRFDLTLPDEHMLDNIRRDNLISGKESIYTIKKQFYTKTGKLIWCRVTVILLRNLDNQPRYFIAGIQDINNEMQLNEQLIKLNEDLLKAQKMGKFGHWSIQLNTNEYAYTGEITEILDFGTEKPDNLLQHLYSMLDEVSCRQLKEDIRQTTNKLRLLNTVLQITTASGKIRYINLEATVSDSGEPVLNGTIKDITEITLLKAEKEKFSKNVNNWGFMLSHELRRPLASILGLLNIFNCENISDLEKTQILDYLQTSGAELDNYSRKLAGQLDEMGIHLKENL